MWTRYTAPTLDTDESPSMDTGRLCWCQFAEAEALIAESASSGLIEQSVAVSLRRQIADLAMKLGKDAAKDNSRLLQKL